MRKCVIWFAYWVRVHCTSASQYPPRHEHFNCFDYCTPLEILWCAIFDAFNWTRLLKNEITRWPIAVVDDSAEILLTKSIIRTNQTSNWIQSSSSKGMKENCTWQSLLVSAQKIIIPDSLKITASKWAMKNVHLLGALWHSFFTDFLHLVNEDDQMFSQPKQNGIIWLSRYWAG